MKGLEKENSKYLNYLKPEIDINLYFDNENID